LTIAFVTRTATVGIDTCQAAGSDYLTDNPGNIHKVSTTALSWKFSCPWWQQVT